MRRMWFMAALVLTACGEDDSPAPQSPGIEWELVFTPDSGIRVDDAAEPAARFDESGVVHLVYRDKSGSTSMATYLATSTDGLNFKSGLSSTGVRSPYTPRLPDGRWRQYTFDPLAAGFRSRTSSDGISYTNDSGVRYALQPQDNGTAGIYDVFADSSGGVTLLYLGDRDGLTNCRRAYSSDGGWTFAYSNGNVLGDDSAGGGGNSFWDQHSYPISGGRRRMTCMRQGPNPPTPGKRKAGEIHSFVSADEGKSWTYERELFDPTSFTEFEVWSLNDPTMVQLPDGRFRIYVAALISNGSGGYKWAILSATSQPPA